MRTEQTDPRYRDIDTWPTRVAVAAMQEGQLAAIAATSECLDALAVAADDAAARLMRGGRLIYTGAGTSGRLAVQDGVELGPTYNWPDDRMAFLLAGGFDALRMSVEGAEDDVERAAHDAGEARMGPTDVAIAVTASGDTPYPLRVVEIARQAGALTIGIANNSQSSLAAHVDHCLVAATGGEVVAGSTRMKAGTAQKALLNILSTAIMIRCGRVSGGLMVDMRLSNEKLRRRAVRMIEDLAQVDAGRARTALEAAGLELKPAILMASGADRHTADGLLERHDGQIGAALHAWRSGDAL